MRKVLVATHAKEVEATIQAALKSDHSFQSVDDRNQLLAAFLKERHDIVFIDIAFFGLHDNIDLNDFEEAFEPFWHAFPGVQIIVLASQDETRKAVKAVKAGASDYLSYPIRPEEVSLVVENLHELTRMQTELDYYRDQFWKDESRRFIHTLSPRMKSVFDKVKSVAPTNTTVLLAGETGTGKGVIAKLLHKHSSRSEHPFIAVHCGAIPDTLIESELFGHEKGSFTGAIRKKLGKFELAREGTIFLDEISTLSSSAQIKLLQVLQENIFQRIGGEIDIKSDARVIAASNENMAELTKNGGFRVDLFYRLNVFPIEIPPLRERREDTPFLIKGFLERLNSHYSKGIQSVHPQVLKALRSYDWPGNIRELENLIERAYILEHSSTLAPESFPFELFSESPGQTHVSVDTSLTLAKAREQALESIERQYLKESMQEHNGRIDATAAAAGVSTRQLRNLLHKHSLRKEDFKAKGKKD
ncbi:sigma-54-dependent transcriptional regulator [Acidobacteriota bacterium]